MSIADHFEHAPDTGFVRDYDSGSARRQFKVSLALIVIMALAASALGFIIRFDNPAHGIDASPGNIPIPTYAGKL